LVTINEKIMEKFNLWWKEWGQLWGFLLLIVSLNGFWLVFIDEMQYDWRYSLTWLIMFFGGAGWYAWQSKKHGWRLPEDIKRTH